MKPIATEKAPAAIGPYSQAIEANGMVFVSGQLGISMKTGEMAEDVSAQAQASLENIRAILTAAGLGMEDIVSTTVYLTDMGDFAAVNAVYAPFFPQNPPARACIAVAGLPKNGLVEIACIAARKA